MDNKKTCAYINKKTGIKCNVCPRNPDAIFCSKHSKSLKSKSKESKSESLPITISKKKESKLELLPITISKKKESKSESLPITISKKKESKSESFPTTISKKKESGKTFKNIENICKNGFINVIKDIENECYFHTITGFIFKISKNEDYMADPIVIGYRQHKNSQLLSLNLEQIELCKFNHWKYDIPYFIETDTKISEEDIDLKYDLDQMQIQDQIQNIKNPVNLNQLLKDEDEDEDEDDE